MAGSIGLAGRFSDAVDWVADSRMASLAAIVAVALIAFLPGFTSIAPVDGDETGYAVAARAMLETGDFSTVRLQTENAEWRPRGPYWVQAFFLSFAGSNPPIWVNRLPSLLAALAATLLTWWMAAALASPRAALLAGLFAATSGVVGLEARLATADAILLAGATLAAGALARIWISRDDEGHDLTAALFWTGLGIAILAKGGVAPGITLGAVLLLSLQRGDFRWLARLRPSVGLVWLFLIASPWLIAVALTLLQGSGEGPSAEFLERVGVPFVLEAPPGSYLLAVPLLAGPCVAFLFTALPWLSREFRRPPILFALCWGGPLWLVAELWPSKPPHHIVSAIPAIALIAAVAVDVGHSRIRGWVSWFFYSTVLLVLPFATALGAPFGFFLIENYLPVAATVGFALAFVASAIAWQWQRAGKSIAAAAMVVVATLITYVGFFGAYVTGLKDLRVGEGLAAVAADSIHCFAPSYAVAGYPEESIVLALGPRTRIVDAWAAADFLNTSGCQVAAVDASQIASFRQHAEDIGITVADRGHAHGVDTRKFRDVDVHLFVVDRSAE